MNRALKNKLEVAIAQLEAGFVDESDLELMNTYWRECLKLGCDATRLAGIIDAETAIDHYDELKESGAAMRPEALMFSMSPDAVWKNIDWFASHNVVPDVIAEYFRHDIYNSEYKPIDLAAKLLKIGASKHLVFDMLALHLKRIADVPEKLIHDLSILMDNRIDQYRIKFWIEKHVSDVDIVKHADEFNKFGINTKPYIEKYLEEHGIPT